MSRVLGILLAIAIFSTQCLCVPVIEKSRARKVDALPAADGNLNVYALPIGQGDSHVIQCPDGALTLYDMGSNEYSWDNPETVSRFMLPQDIRDFFGTQQDLIQNIFITHNHYDHYVLLVRTFNQTGDLTNLQNIYMSCTEADTAWRVDEWITLMNFRDRVRLFNNGAGCGPNGIPCEAVNVCPNDADVSSTIMAANMGGHCSDGGNINMESIVLKLERSGSSFIMMGDFEDETSNWNEEGLQKMMVDYYGTDIETTIYSLSHHGASSLANKPVLQNALKPKALFASANTDYSYKHPRCSIFDGFIIYTGTLCQPGAPVGDPMHCGDHPSGDVALDTKLQSTYECVLAGGDTSCPDERCLIENNEYAIYTTTPDGETINLVKASVDASGNWGFTMNLENSPAKNV